MAAPERPRARLFLDTSGLFAGLWSETGGARALLQLGEARALELVVSADVLTELEGALRRKAPALLGLVALLLDQARVSVGPPPDDEARQQAAGWVAHRGDAAIVAAALAAGVDYLVTLDAQHLLGNPALRDSAPFAVGTPGDALAWWRAHWTAAEDEG